MTVQASHNDLQEGIRALGDQFAAYREENARNMRALVESNRVTAEAVERLEQQVGHKANSDGEGGQGLIGDVESLIKLRNMGQGVFWTLGVGITAIAGFFAWAWAALEGKAP